MLFIGTHIQNESLWHILLRYNCYTTIADRIIFQNYAINRIISQRESEGDSDRCMHTCDRELVRSSMAEIILFFTCLTCMEVSIGEQNVA